MRETTIYKRLMSIFFIFALFNVLFLLFTIITYKEFQINREEYYTKDLVYIEYMKDINSNLERINDRFISLYLMNEEETINERKKDISSLIDQIDRSISDINSDLLTNSLFYSNWLVYKSQITEELSKNQSDNKAFSYYVSNIQRKQKKIQDELDMVIKEKKEKNKEFFSNLENDKDQFFFTYVYYFVVLCFVTFFTHHLIKRLISRPIKSFISELNIHSKGNLQVQNHPTQKDEIGHLQKSLNKLITKLKSIIEDIEFVSSKIYRAQEDIQHYQKVTNSLSNNIKDKIQHYEESIDDLVMKISQSDEIVSLFSNEIKEFSNSSELLFHKSVNIKSETENKLSKIDQTNHNVLQLENSITDFSFQLSHLHKMFVNMEPFINVVNELGENLKTLSLYSNIEAATTSSKEFKLASEDIKKTGYLTEQYYLELREVFKEIHSTIENSISVTEKAINKTTEGKNSVNETVLVFNQMISDINLINSNTAKELSISLEQKELKELLLSNFHHIRIVLNINIETGKKLSTIIENQINDIDHLSRITNQLLSSSLRLKKKLNRFIY